MARVLQVVNSLDEADGGPARNAWELHLKLRAHSVRTVALHGGGAESLASRFHADEASASVGHCDHRQVEGADHWSWMRLVKEIARSKVVIVHGYYLLWLPIVVLVARGLGKRVLLTPHGTLGVYEASKSRRKKQLWAWVVGWWCDRLIAVFVVGSQREADELRTAARRHIVVAGIGTEGRIARVRKKSVEEELVLVSMSRIAPKKRIDIMIRMMADRRLQERNARLEIAGVGSAALTAQLQELARELGVANQVTFVGHVTGEEKEKLWRRAHVFVLPSDDENFGIGVAEAAAHAVPVVASSRTAAATLMAKPGGHAIDSEEPAVFVDAVLSIAANDARYALASKDAWRQCKELFSWEVVAQRWEAAIEPASGAQAARDSALRSDSPPRRR